MTRIGMVLIAAAFALGLGATGVVAQPVGCDFCGNHFWYNEHIHGNDMHRLYDNEQNHGGDWYPYYCGVDHRLCDKIDMVLSDAAAAVTGAVEASDWTLLGFARLLESLAEDGIEATVSESGLALAASCIRSGTEDAEMTTVALPEIAWQLVRDAMNPVIQGP